MSRGYRDKRPPALITDIEYPKEYIDDSDDDDVERRHVQLWLLDLDLAYRFGQVNMFYLRAVSVLTSMNGLVHEREMALRYLKKCIGEIESKKETMYHKMIAILRNPDVVITPAIYKAVYAVNEAQTSIDSFRHYTENAILCAEKKQAKEFNDHRSYDVFRFYRGLRQVLDTFYGVRRLIPVPPTVSFTAGSRAQPGKTPYVRKKRAKKGRER